jgi:hypothetical protein
MLPRLEIALFLAVCTASTVAAAEGPAIDTDLQALPEAETLGAPLQPRSVQTRRIFVNFDGPYLRSGDRDDATRDLTRASALVGQRAVYGGDTAERLAIVQAVRADFEAFNVAVTSNRPASGDYVMAVVGPNRPDDAGWESLLGSAFLDCWDAQTANDVSFAFHDADSEASAVARTISQEVAHGFGLEHVDDPSDVMYPSAHGGDPSFVDDCNPVVAAPGIGIACTSQHVEACGAVDRQNSFQELMMVLGPALPDDIAPDVEFERPLDGTEFAVGSAVPIRAHADDDGAIEGLVLYKNGERIAEDRQAPFEWLVNEDEIGAVEYTVAAYDIRGNATMSHPVVVFVGMPAPQRGNGTDANALTCNAGRARPPIALMLLLLTALTRRRRR